MDRKGKNNPMFSRKHSDETIELFRKQRKGKYIGEENPMYGRNHSNDAKQKVSNARKNKTWIHNGFVTKSVCQNDLDEFLVNGWQKGRAMDKRGGKNYILRNFIGEIDSPE